MPQQAPLPTEITLTRILQMPDIIQHKLKIVDQANSDLANLEMETKPENALAEIECLHIRELNKR